MNRGPVIIPVQGAGADIYLRLGFCPAFVRVLGGTLEDIGEWFLSMLADDYHIKTLNTDGVRTYISGGVQLVKFNDGIGTLPGSGGAPEVLEQAEWYKANGIKLDANITAIGDGSEAIVMAYPLSVPIVKCIHDGGDNCNTYFQDSSVDFMEAGVSSGQTWLVINETNDDYGFVKDVQRPVGQKKYCRCTLAENEAGDATSAADIDDNDVLILIPKQWAQYPLSGVGAMD
jgi:hypothetical protein